MPQIALVTDEHDEYVLVGVVAELPQPSLDVLIRQVLGDVVDEQGADRAPVVRRCDGTVTLLARRVPYLSFYGFTIDLNGQPSINTDGHRDVAP